MQVDNRSTEHWTYSVEWADSKQHHGDVILFIRFTFVFFFSLSRFVFRVGFPVCALLRSMYMPPMCVRSISNIIFQLYLFGVAVVVAVVFCLRLLFFNIIRSLVFACHPPEKESYYIHSIHPSNYEHWTYGFLSMLLNHNFRWDGELLWIYNWLCWYMVYGSGYRYNFAPLFDIFAFFLLPVRPACNVSMVEKHWAHERFLTIGNGQRRTMNILNIVSKDPMNFVFFSKFH